MSLISMSIPKISLCAFLCLISNVIVMNGAILPTVDIQGSVEKVTSTKSRQNKGIFVSTTITTSTLSTSTLCYITDGVTSGTVCDRKKRSILEDPIEGIDDKSDQVLPSTTQTLSPEEESEKYIVDTLRSQKEFEGLDLNQIVSIARAGREKRNSGEQLLSPSDKADAKFILFFWTSTSTKTTTTYTKSYTLTLTQCTPSAALSLSVSGLAVSTCG